MTVQNADLKHFFFFFDTLSSLLRRIYYHQMLSFQASVRHIPCTIWSSSQLSTYDFIFICWITSHIMLLPWGPRCLGSASFAPWRPRQHRHLRGLAPSPSKDHCPGAGYIIFTPRKERLRMGYTVGLYFPRLASVSWNPLAHVVQDLAGFVASHLGIKQAQYG